MISNNYCLITPAKNEELYIQKTIESVILQTILPHMWIIVDDGSSDRTAEIVKKYENKFNFIKLLQLEKEDIRNFGSKVHAFNVGYDYIKNVDYDYIGNLDADITFENDYYESILGKFKKDERLGIAGGNFFDLINNKKYRINNSSDSVRGAVQLFRKKCFIDIGGYIPLQLGGIDSVAEFKAKMNLWKVHTFQEIPVLHHRKTGIEGSGGFSIGYKRGKQDYSLGYHPIFELIRCFYRFFDKPYFFGSFTVLLGFYSSFFSNDKILIDKYLVDYIRNEQIFKLKNFFYVLFKIK